VCKFIRGVAPVCLQKRWNMRGEKCPLSSLVAARIQWMYTAAKSVDIKWPAKFCILSVHGVREHHSGLSVRSVGVSYSAQRLDLFAWCVRLSRLLVGFRTHFKSLHSFIFFCCLPTSTDLSSARLLTNVC